MALKTAHIGPRTGLCATKWFVESKWAEEETQHFIFSPTQTKYNSFIPTRLLPPATSVHATLMGSKSMFFHISSACFTAYVLTCYLLGMLLLLCYISQPLNSDKLKGMNKKCSYTICFSVYSSSKKKINSIHFIPWSWGSTNWFNIIMSFISFGRNHAWRWTHETHACKQVTLDCICCPALLTLPFTHRWRQGGRSINIWISGWTLCHWATPIMVWKITKVKVVGQDHIRFSSFNLSLSVPLLWLYVTVEYGPQSLKCMTEQPAFM